MKKHYARLLVTLVVLLTFATTATAQELAGAQATRNALSTFPESQGVLFVNIRRTIEEAMPRLMSPVDVQKHLAEARKVGVDLNNFEYVIVGVRLADALPPNAVPDFVVLVKGRGSFSPDALLTLARVAADSQGMKSTQESYGSKTINLVALNKEPTPGETTKPKKFPVSEIATTALDSGTLVIGTPGYVRATIDAAGGGQGRLNPAFIDLALRNPTALSSLTVVIPPELPNYLKGMGVPQNDEATRIISWLKQVSISNGMSALDFNLQAAIQTDNAEHASAISGLIAMGLTAAESHVNEDVQRHKGNPKQAEEAQVALSAIKAFTNTTQGNIVVLSTSVPQKTLAALVKKNMSPPPPPPTPVAPSIKKPTRAASHGRRRSVKKN